jgi:hypothetical protein
MKATLTKKLSILYRFHPMIALMVWTPKDILFPCQKGHANAAASILPIWNVFGACDYHYEIQDQRRKGTWQEHANGRAVRRFVAGRSSI